MRIAVCNWTRQRVGGAEATISTIMTGLARGGHEVGLVYELAGRADAERLPVSDGPASWCVRALGAQRVLAALRDWKPDVLEVHGLLDPRFERRVLETAPAVFFAHSYYGICISGTKTFTFPHVRHCQREFGVGCLVRYYPRRIGGWNPLTMVREYVKQASRLAMLRTYQRLLVLSEHMRREYLRHGFSPANVVRLPFPPVVAAADASNVAQRSYRSQGQAWRLLFVGRMDALKGGVALLDALPDVARLLRAPVSLTFVGDGPARRNWERRAVALVSRGDGVTVRFRGWLQGDELESCYRESDLLVVPSLWPEPFGRVGLEAAAHGLPSAAYAVGGIPEWLTDGRNGTLAPGDPPTSFGLADAIVRALEDPGRYAALRLGALYAAQQATAEPFVSCVIASLEHAATGS